MPDSCAKFYNQQHRWMIKYTQSIYSKIRHLDYPVFKHINIRHCLRRARDLSWTVLWRMSARGSLEDIFESATNPKLRFEGKEIPRGSPAFQLVVTDVVGKNKEDETQSDNEEDKAEKPKRQYHGRRRNTVAHLYHGEPPEWTSLLANARRMSVLPEIGELAAEEDSRGRRRSSLCPPTNRSRSLSPMTMDVLRRNSVAFGSSKERETVIK